MAGEAIPTGGRFAMARSSANSTTRCRRAFSSPTDDYSDFRLTLSSKMVESENHAGVCFWGEIAQQGENQWYTHGPLVIFPNPSMWDYNEGKGLRVFKPTTEKVTSQHEWVKVEILAQGNRVRAAFNGVEVLEWREPDRQPYQGRPDRRAASRLDGAAGSHVPRSCDRNVSSGRQADYGYAVTGFSRWLSRPRSVS